MASVRRAAKINLLTSPMPVLFGFDSQSLPLQHGLRLKLATHRLSAAAPKNIVITPAPNDSPDSKGCYYYGSVCTVHDELWMWYHGVGEPEPDKKSRVNVCLAKSRDGVSWDKPGLGLVEYGGNRNNHLVDLNLGDFGLMACVVLHDPEDPAPARRFKMIFETRKYAQAFAVAYSPDGTRWTESPDNPRGSWMEPSGAIRWDGADYVNGQGGKHWAA